MHGGVSIQGCKIIYFYFYYVYTDWSHLEELPPPNLNTFLGKN